MALDVGVLAVVIGTRADNGFIGVAAAVNTMSLQQPKHFFTKTSWVF